MVGSIITTIETPVVPFQLEENFGIGLGIEEDSEQYHLYADEQTALFVVRALNRTHGGHEIGFSDVFRDRIEPSGGFKHVSYIAWLNAGPDIVRALTSPHAVEDAEDAAVQLLAQMNEYGEDLLHDDQVVPSGTHERLVSAIKNEAAIRKQKPLLERDTTFNNRPTFTSLTENGERPLTSKTRAWLESHMHPIILEFWKDQQVFADFTNYGGVVAMKYEEPQQPESYRMALERIQERRLAQARIDRDRRIEEGQTAISHLLQLAAQ